MQIRSSSSSSAAINLPMYLFVAFRTGVAINSDSGRYCKYLSLTRVATIIVLLCRKEGGEERGYCFIREYSLDDSKRRRSHHVHTYGERCNLGSGCLIEWNLVKLGGTFVLH